MLTEVSGEPDGFDQGVSGREASDGFVRVAWTVIPDQDDFAHHKRIASGCHRILREGQDLVNQRRQGLAAGIDGYDNTDRVNGSVRTSAHLSWHAVSLVRLILSGCPLRLECSGAWRPGVHGNLQ